MHNTLIMTSAFVYAPELNIIVRRTTTNNLQTTIMDSWIGALSLRLISDDMFVEGTNFNQVLDGFAFNDRATLRDVQVPGITCSDSAVVKRYWFLTVKAIDNAGSLRPFAVLEVVSTETGAKIYPLDGRENLPESMTDENGMITVAILANTTDSSGDYFVGSIRFRLMFDKIQPYIDDPIYTEWRQVNMKSNIFVTLVFSDTIESPEKEILYVVYSVTQVGPSLDLKLYNHTFATDELAIAFLNQTMGIDPDRTRVWDVIKNETVLIVFKATARINAVWVPLKAGEVTISMLPGPMYDPTDVHVNNNDTVNGTLQWGFWPDDDGYGNGTLVIPDIIGNFQMHIEISGGDFDPLRKVMTNRLWNFTVVPPQTIEIVNAFLSPDYIELGTRMQISGTVRFIYGGSGVEGAEIKVTGTHIGTGQGRTDEEGRFSIQMHDVGTPMEVIADEGFNWQALFIGLIILGIVFAAGIGSVVMYRRHYGDLVECGECGAFILANSVSCSKCGIEFETDLARCSECEAWIPANSNSCPVCGTAFTIASLEKQVLAEEADEELTPVDEVTTTTTTMAPLTLYTSPQSTRWGDKDEKRRRRIKKRVKKRLTLAEAGGPSEEGGPDDAKDLFVGDEADEATRLPGLSLDESALSEDELQRLLPTEDMLKELMLTSEHVPIDMDAEALEGDMLGEEGEELEVPEDDDDTLDEVEGETPVAEGEEPTEGEEPAEDLGDELEEIPPPDDMGDEGDEEELDVSDMPETEEEPDLGDIGLDVEDTMPEGRELLTELGLVAEVPTSATVGLDLEAPEGEDEESALGGLLTEEDESKEAPKLCPNCGGNWILYKDGEYTCRICGEKW